MTALTSAEEISDIAFGFMGSKALFAGLHFELFTHLAGDDMKTAEQVATCTGLHPERSRTLLTALASMGLIEAEDGRFGNSPAAEAYLVKGAKYDFGDYLRLQVDQQMYGLMDQINLALADELPESATNSYADWFSDPEQARVYSHSQHAGSLGPARGLAKLIDLSKAHQLLDIGGGTGAFAITLCRSFPGLSATIVEFPNVAEVGRGYVAKAGMSDRITYREGDGLEAAWPDGQDAVLMSYLFSGVPGTAHDRLIERAWEHLVPGGHIMIHDFVVDADRTGPKLAALWQLQHTAFTPTARSLDDEGLQAALVAQGFTDVAIRPMIPGMTMLATGVKPG
jgi:precorrin-6B methylase 2